MVLVWRLFTGRSSRRREPKIADKDLVCKQGSVFFRRVADGFLGCQVGPIDAVVRPVAPAGGGCGTCRKPDINKNRQVAMVILEGWSGVGLVAFS